VELSTLAQIQYKYHNSKIVVEWFWKMSEDSIERYQ
jgi:hypothetical protein